MMWPWSILINIDFLNSNLGLDPELGHPSQQPLDLMFQNYKAWRSAFPFSFTHTSAGTPQPATSF